MIHKISDNNKHALYDDLDASSFVNMTISLNHEYDVCFEKGFSPFMPTFSHPTFKAFFSPIVILIHSSYPQSLPVVIIVFTHVVRTSVRTFVRPSPLFKIPQNKTMFTAAARLWVWIIDDT